MAGRMGGDRIKTLNVKIVKILAEENLVLVNGSVPGAIGSYIVLECPNFVWAGKRYP